MRSVTLAILGLGGMLALGTVGASAAPAVPPAHAQGRTAIVRADYEWHHRHYHHRRWEHDHWRYWN